MKRIKDAMDKTSWGWIVALGLAPMLITGCNPRTADRDESCDPVRYQDRETGCMYLTTARYNTLTPRIAADGKTHMGCKGPKP